MKFLKYIGDATTRILSKVDLQSLAAEAETTLSNFEGDALEFTKGVAVEINTDVAEFIASHPLLAHEFHLLSDDEAAAEAADNPPADGSSSSSTVSPSTPATPSGDEPPAASSTETTSDSSTSASGAEPTV